MARLPNHKERRAMNKRNKTHYTLQDYATIFAVNGIQKGEDISYLKKYLPFDFMHKDNWDLFPDGTKVKLKKDAILSRPEDDLTEEFKTWINDHVDSTLTLSREKDKEERHGLVEVKEEPKWLFDLFNDLLCWNEEFQEFMEPQLIEDLNNGHEKINTTYSVIKSLMYEPEESVAAEVEKIYKSANGVKDPTILEQIDNQLNDFMEEYVKIPESEDDTAETFAEAEEVLAEEENKKEGDENK